MTNVDIFKTVTGILKITEWVDQLNSKYVYCKPFPLDPDRSDDAVTLL